MVAELSEKAKTDIHHVKPVKPIPNRKLDKEVPLINCFTAPCKGGCPIGQDIPEYIELCKKINRRYKERKISDNSNTLEVNITRECIKEFLENPPELVKRCDKHILLGLLYLTAFPSKKKVIASALCFVTGFYLGGMAVFIVGYDSLASIIFGLLAMLFLSIWTCLDQAK